jgi:hypothetical protein
MALPNERDRRVSRPDFDEVEGAAVVHVETTTSRDGVHAQEFTLSKAAEAALQVESI